MTHRNFEAEFRNLVTAFNAARQNVIDAETIGMPEDRARAEACRQHWRIMKERIIDLLEDWDDIGGQMHPS